MVSNGKQLIIDDAPFLEISASHMTLNQRIIKRLMDLCRFRAGAGAAQSAAAV